MSEQVAKGRTLEDGTYIYTCGHCGGTGRIAETVCNWCYGLDTNAILAAMSEGARGQRYYGLLKAFLSVRGKAIVDEARRLRDEQIVLKVVDLAYIHVKFELNFKATVEWLEETQVIHSGVYEAIQDRGIKVRELVEKAREKYPEMALKTETGSSPNET